MYNKEAQSVSTMAADGLLLTNQFLELDDTHWAGVFSEDLDEDMAVNVISFAVACHILQVNSSFTTSIESMRGTTSIPRKDADTLFTTNPSIIDLGLNLDTNISATANN